MQSENLGRQTEQQAVSESKTHLVRLTLVTYLQQPVTCEKVVL